MKKNTQHALNCIHFSIVLERWYLWVSKEKWVK